MHCLQAVVCICNLTASAISVLFSALARATGWWTFEELMPRLQAVVHVIRPCYILTGY